jgi:hypothetical protein
MDKLNQILEDLLVKKAPALPKNVKDFLVKYAYIFNIIGIIMTIPAIFALLGLNAVIHIFAKTSIIGVLFLIVEMLFRIKALPGLKNRKIDGWNMLYYAALTQAVYSLINFDLGGFVIGTLVSLYFIFQVKSYYKK